MSQSKLPEPLFFVDNLPCPPSTNGLFKNSRKGRTSNPHYLAWQEQSKHIIKSKLHQPEYYNWAEINRPISIIVMIDRPSLRRDLDNCVKALFDIFKKAGVLYDDSLVEAYFVCWRPSDKPHEASVYIYEADELPMMVYHSLATSNRAIGGELKTLARPTALENLNGSGSNKASDIVRLDESADHNSVRTARAG